MNDTTKQIVTAGVSAGVAAAVAIVVTHYLTKQATLDNVASGKTPLPAGSTPTTSGDKPIVVKPAPAPAPQPAPLYNPNLVQMANSVAQAINCPPGYHWGGYNPNLPKCVPDAPLLPANDSP